MGAITWYFRAFFCSLLQRIYTRAEVRSTFCGLHLCSGEPLDVSVEGQPAATHPGGLIYAEKEGFYVGSRENAPQVCPRVETNDLFSH